MFVKRFRFDPIQARPPLAEDHGPHFSAAPCIFPLQ